jgi:ATP-binding cassette, subfamily B, multidrug efflux pump
MACRSVTCPSTSSVTASVSCSRTCSCSAATSNTTSDSAARRSDASVSSKPPAVGADAVIGRLPGGYAEPLGERGASLSVGERQLLSFARALAYDPQVLILDEATSSVDSTLEQRIDDALAELMRGRTSLVVAHRLSTVQNADRILVLHHGELREEGTHEELLTGGGLYARLHELQFVRADGLQSHREAS